MRRAKIGDVYYAKVPNGYKIFQWAYRIPKRGDYIRVFDGLYDDIPANIAEIIEGPHSYIIGFYASRAYRIGLTKLLGNYPVPEKYPFPDYRIKFWINQKGEVFSIWLTPNNRTVNGSLNTLSFPVSAMNELPPEFRDEKLLNSVVSPDILLYLFDCNFSFSMPQLLSPRHTLGDEWEVKYQVYEDMVQKAIQQDIIRKNTNPQ